MIIRNIDFDFKGKRISNDAGSISVDKYLGQIKLEQALEAVFPKAPKFASKRGRKVEYPKHHVLFQQIKSYMKGYENPTEMSRTKNDPMHNLVQKPMPSQSTFSRIHTGFKKEDESILKAFNKKLIQNYLKELVRQNGGKKLEIVNISDDSTKIITKGKQEGSAYISHYRVVGYHPDLITEDGMRLIMEGELRNGNVYSSKGSELLLQEVIELLAPFTKKIIFRGDSAYAKPEIFNELRAPEDLEIEYYIKEKTYWSWLEKAQLEVEYNGKKYHPLELPKTYFEEKDETGKKRKIARYFEFEHQCDTWEKPEKIVVQMKYKEEGEQKLLIKHMNKDIELLVTNANIKDETTGKAAFKEYGKRGKQEQIIEEFKNDSHGKTLSHEKKVANACDFYLKIIAHNLMQIMRLETLKDTKYATCRISTMRRLFVNVGGLIITSGGKFLIHLAESFAYKKWYRIVMERIPLIHFTLC